MSSQQPDPIDAVSAGDSSPSLGIGLDYPMIQFPWPPWTLTVYMKLTQAQATAWAGWLNEAESDRFPVFTSFLEKAGGVTAWPVRESKEWTELGAWVYRWFPVAVEPYIDRKDSDSQLGFFQDQPEVRLGSAWAPWIPSGHGYSPSADALLHSVAVDLAALVTTSARASRPGLRWQAGSDPTFSDFFLTLDLGEEPFPLIRRIREFLVQSVADPRGTRGQQLRQWRCGELYRCYQWAATGEAPAPEWEQFPGSNEDREGCRYSLIKPSPTEPEPPSELVTPIAAFRQAGWFGKSKLSDARLAQAVATTWRAYEGEEITPISAEINWRLLALDCDRTWSEDVNAGACPGDNLHERTLFAISKVVGKSMRSLRDAVEAWVSPDGDVELSFWLSRRQCRVRLPSPRQYLSPALITGINELLPDSSPRLWFAGSPSPIAVVTRATAAERDALQHLTGVALSDTPPGWWTRLAPLPCPGDLPRAAKDKA